MTWGDDVWGSSPWGDDAPGPVPPTFLSARLTSVDLISTRLIKLTFNVDMRVDSGLLNINNYTITPTDGGREVNVVRVIPPLNVEGTLTFMLYITSYDVGKNYDVTVASSLKTTRGNTVEGGFETQSFYGRKTKLDSAQSNQQSLYSRAPDSIVGAMLIAIMSEDERIGGSAVE